jgi:hypothetical protein
MVSEKGGASMQERTRYYITKSGEEPTVRSVKVAKSSPEGDDSDVSSPDAATAPEAPAKPISAPARAVQRLVHGAVRGRPTES